MRAGRIGLVHCKAVRLHNSAGGALFIKLILEGAEVIKHRRCSVDDGDIVMLAQLFNSLFLCVDISQMIFLLHEIKGAITGVFGVTFD